MTPPPTVQGTPAPVALEPTRAISLDSADQKIDTIREILVGDELQVLNRRFQKLGKSVEAHCSKLGSQLITKFESFKALSQSDIDELREAVDESMVRMEKENATLSAEFKSGMDQLTKLEERLDQFKTAVAEQIRKMHQQFYKQMSEFSRLVKSQQEEVTRRAISREDFARVLSGLAGSLTSETSRLETPRTEQEEQEEARI
ncbi:MAG: hypothetical protein GWO24_08360 [Akkermansiaceae bacterium]|nr:hypothetical protein [Akkermansiaceae bacterium]